MTTNIGEIESMELPTVKNFKERSFLKNEKWQIGNSETSEIWEISEKLFRVFLFPSFQFCPIAKIENSDLKTSEKNFRVFWEFQVFRVFDLANFSSVEKIGVKNTEMLLCPRVKCLCFCFEKYLISTGVSWILVPSDVVC